MKMRKENERTEKKTKDFNYIAKTYYLYIIRTRGAHT